LKQKKNIFDMGLAQFAQPLLERVGLKKPSKEDIAANDEIFEFVPIAIDDLKRQGVWKNAEGERLRVNADKLTMTSYTAGGQDVFYNSAEDILQVLTEGQYVLVPGTTRVDQVTTEQGEDQIIDQNLVDQKRVEEVLAQLRRGSKEEVADLRPKAPVIATIVSASRQVPAKRASKEKNKETVSGDKSTLGSGGDEGSGERLIIDEIIANSASVQQLVESVQGESSKDTTGVIAELLKKLMEDKALFDSEVTQAKEAGGKNRKKLQEFGQRCATLWDRAIEAQQALEMLLAKNTAGTSEKAFEAVSELPNNPVDETVGGSINASVVSSASVTVDTSGPTPEPSTLVVPKSTGETPASQGEIPQGQERESSKLDEVLEQWGADVRKRLEEINTPEAYAEFRDGMTKPDRIGKRHFFALSDVKSAAGIIELSPVPSKKIADTERALEDLTRAKFEALVKADLDTQYDREQERIDGASSEAELDALVATWVQSPNVVLTWKDVLTKIPEVEQKMVNQEYRGCSEELSENVRQKREFFKQEAVIAEERRPLTLFLERPIGERCVVKYRKFIKDEWQKFFDALRYEVVKNKKKDLPWKKKIEEWNAFYLPEVKKIIVGHIAKQKGMTEADGEAIFLILLRDLDEEFSEKKKEVKDT